MHQHHAYFVQQTSRRATLTAKALAKGATHIGIRFANGHMKPALAEFDRFSAQLELFLNYVVLAEVMMAERNPAASLSLAAYKSAIFCNINDLTRALERREYQTASVIMCRKLSSSLREYQRFASSVSQALDQPFPMAA